MLPKNEVVRAERAALSLMTCVCDIYEYDEVIENGITGHKRSVVQTSVPCRISYTTGVLNGKLKAGQEKNGDGISTEETTVKIFLPRGIAVKPGSFISVKKDNKIMEFKSSGVPAEYETHTEIVAEYAKEWA